MSSVKKIISCDGLWFQVDEAVAKYMMIGGGAGNVIPLPRVRSHILAKIIEYCKKHAKPEDNSAAHDEELKAWDAEFVRLDPSTLLGLMQAAHHLNIGGLMDLIAEAIAALIRGKTTEQIRETFNIKNDFTPEEEEEAHKKYEDWRRWHGEWPKEDEECRKEEEECPREEEECRRKLILSIPRKVIAPPKAKKYGRIMSWMLAVSLMLVAGYSTGKRWGLGQSRELEEAVRDSM